MSEEGYKKTIAKIASERNELKRENTRLERYIERMEDPERGAETWVVFNKDWRTPACSKHGAMLCMDKARGMWRCPARHIGVATHGFLEYLRREFDGVIVIK